MSELAQYLASGLTVGAIYALVAVGFVVVYNVTGIINFAQGEFLMLGALITIALAGQVGHPARLPLALAIPIAVAAVAAIGAGAERLALHPRRGASPVTLLIVTIGISAVLRGGALLAFGSGTYGLRAFSPGGPLHVAGAVVSRQTLWTIGIAVACVLALTLFFERTAVGKAFRACEINPLAARLAGISPSRFGTLAFALSAALAALAGAVLAPTTFAVYDMGLPFVVKGFAAWVLGGMGSAAGAVLGGLVLGLIEALTTGYAPGVVRPYLEALPFVVLIAVLLVRPTGLIAGVGVRRV